MNKILKYGFAAVAAALIISAAVLAYVAATFDPNNYKEQIIKVVKDRNHRDLHLDGNIVLSFFPSIGAKLVKVSLSEINSDEQFAAIDAARVSLSLLPLFSGRVEVNEISLSGVQGTLIKHTDGTTNIDDLLGKGAQEDKNQPERPPVKFDIAAISINQTNLNYRDEGSGALYTIKDLNLSTGRIINKLPVKISLSAVVQSNQPRLEITTHLKTTLTFDLDKQLYHLEGLDLDADGAALDIAKLKVNASGEVNVDLAATEFLAKQFKLKVSGVKIKDEFSASVEAPTLILTKDKFSGEKLLVNAKLNGSSGNILAALSLPSLEGNAQSFKIDALALDLDVKQAEQSFKFKLSLPLTGNFIAKQFKLNNLTLALTANGDKLPNKSIESVLKGSMQVDALKETLQLALAGGLLQSQLKAKIGINNFSDPALNFDLDVDQVDADLYLPKSTKPVAQNETEQPIDLSALRKLNLEGTLKIGALKVANLKSTNLHITVKAHKGELKVNPLSANLYQGSLNGNLNVNAESTPVISLNQTLSGINIAALLKDAANFDTLEGKGSVLLNLNMHGNTVSAMKKVLDGSLTLNLADGAVKGINIAKKLREAQTMFSKGANSSQTQALNKEEKTDFSELKASFKIVNGIAHNDDLSMKSPVLRVAGNGDINIANDSINYLAKATLAKTLEGQGGKDNVSGITVPVRLSGPFSDLKYTLDYSALLSDVTKLKIENKKDEIKSKLQEQLKGGLNNLFR